MLDWPPSLRDWKSGLIEELRNETDGRWKNELDHREFSSHSIEFACFFPKAI